MSEYIIVHLKDGNHFNFHKKCKNYDCRFSDKLVTFYADNPVITSSILASIPIENIYYIEHMEEKEG